MFSKILIANRGEIACRVAKTAHKMGIKSVAVHSDVDSNALHVRRCDEAIALGGNTALESYLATEKIINAAKQSGAEAIHPGYGFLSENAEFAKQCAAEGLIFIGPSAESIRAMGSKNSARQIVAKAGVAVVPGYDGDEQDLQSLRAHADETGYPILIKAVSGGGGKGMRIVDRAEDFSASLDAVKRESLAAFADDQVLLEKYIPVARHIEVQIFSDNHGNTVHLFERDCSMQRRHQKVIEESPAPLISSRTRDSMTAAAIACARSVDYRGAGTVEFLYSPDESFYFMEMNTRLQVEHPVTEMVTGQDLVEWQLTVAAGEPLPCSQQEILLRGHAIETRIYAENPKQQFLPSSGEIIYLQQPRTEGNIRIDSGIQRGGIISPYYDPMISKLIVWADKRDKAITLLAEKLEQTVILGVRNNIEFLHKLVSHDLFQQGKPETRFIDANIETLVNHPGKHENSAAPNSVSCRISILELATAYRHLHAMDVQRQSGNITSSEQSPWNCDGFQLSDSRMLNHVFTGSPNEASPGSPGSPWETQKLSFSFVNGLFHFPKSDNKFHGKLTSDHQLEIQTDNQLFKVTAAQASADYVFLHVHGEHQVIAFHEPMDINAAGMQDSGQSGGSVLSPMPGTVIAVMIAPGQVVKIGDPLMILEAMKMEHQIKSGLEGKITDIYCQQGDQVQDGTALLEIEVLKSYSHQLNAEES